MRFLFNLNACLSKFQCYNVQFPYFDRFILIDLGCVGRHSDGGVFSNSSFGQDLEDGRLSLPAPSPPPGTSSPDVPYVIVGDEAFPLRNYLLRPFPGRNLPGKKFVNSALT